ncbi:glycosyltransferase [Magnetospira sp. QH-2]|uniref:glycosyltransferase n=1 Tax=Magnetospira sp. (strain QH-2) TaxID=1288970 RepID=UPI0003E816CF|nr:glycosyltransferase [Magnetospira sp. QH-2]CCQ73407.1 Putative GT2 [Magnetospira sp. QH-2]
MIILGLALISLTIWIYLVAFRGRFWACDQMLPLVIGELSDWPAVTAVIPARDEAETIGESLKSLLEQDYPGDLTVILIDDNSRDETGKVARAAAGDDPRLHILSGQPLPVGWVGKMWAMFQGVEAAGRISPGAEYLLLTDADIRHGQGGVRRLVVKAETEKRDLVSLMVRLRCESFWEKLLVPAFVYFFQKLYPFPWVNNPGRAEAGAAGGCMLVRTEALAASGGIVAIRDRVIDDVALGKRLKAEGSIWLGLTKSVDSLRPYDGLSQIWRMVARTAFVQLEHSGLMLIGTVMGMALIYLLPPLGFLFGDLWVAAPAGAAWLLMTFSYGPTLRLYGLSPLRGLLLPVAALFYTLMTLDSARRHWMGRGGAWKGRHYPELG